MVSRQKALKFFVLLIVMVFVLSACERTSPAPDTPTAVASEGGEQSGELTPPGGETGNTDAQQPTTGEGETGAEQTDPNVAGETETAVDTPEGEAPTSEEGQTETEQPTGEGEATAEETDPNTDASAEQPASESETTTAETTQPSETAVTTPPADGAVHVVQPGENLFRIGLKYGLAWDVLAKFNNIPNPNYVVVGQSINIPPAGGGTGGQPPADDNYTYYVVQPGDNLFRIGLSHGLSWTLLAEANGITNPNHIVTGQVLKIPVN